MTTNYARKMAVLRARIFGELARPTTLRYWRYLRLTPLCLPFMATHGCPFFSFLFWLYLPLFLTAKPFLCTHFRKGRKLSFSRWYAMEQYSTIYIDKWCKNKSTTNHVSFSSCLFCMACFVVNYSLSYYHTETSCIIASPTIFLCEEKLVHLPLISKTNHVI